MRSSSSVVVVADGDTAVRTMLYHLLGDAGYQVAPCADAAECFRVARMLRPHLALVDISGRGRDAFWLAVLQLHSDPVTRRIPVVLMTTNLPWLNQAHPQLDSLGLFGIAKPFDTHELLGAVAERRRSPSRRVPDPLVLAPTG